ncbi:MAG: flagellar basal body P-ring formation chaperone FlgA [Rhodospirillaceae bacterium]|nr:flagellar basal body P-ring formation chaperone FlgA [Rhodospirillaceae bacterium]
MTARQSIFAALTVLLLLFSIPAPAAPPANLRANVVVDGDTIKLGDIFDGAIAQADKVIAYAPAPGRKLVLEATGLYRVARAYRLRWRPTSRFDRAIVERRSLIIETDQIVDAVREALHKQAKLTDEMDVELDDRAMRIYLPTNAVPMVSVHSISYQQRSGRFSAVLTAGDRQYSAAGGAHKLVQVPTLAQRLYADDIIGARDLVWKPMRVNRLDPRTVLNESKLVGMSPRRPIVAGRAVLTTEIQPPTLVKRGKHVTIHLQTKFMRLTAKGKSLQNGGRGDVVRVQNVDSGKTIEARVTGPEQVTVSTTGALALN